MSTPTLKPAPEVVTATPAPPMPGRRRPRLITALRIAAIWLAILLPLAGAGWYAARAYRTLSAVKVAPIPVTHVRRGDVTFTITAKGELKGGNSEQLTAPMTSGGEMHITSLRQSGEVVKAGDVVVKFDTSEQQYKLREAQADVAEADQKVAQARAQLEAQKEEDRYALLKARSDLRLAELEVRKNPTVAVITAKQNDMALAQARQNLAELEKNMVNHQDTNQAAIASQEAARSKAQVQAATAKQNIDAMVLTAHRDGYVALKKASSNFYFTGMELPEFRIGDSVQPGMAVAEIPDLNNWEVTATITELDRGHLAVGQKADIEVIPVPGRHVSGHVKDLGGSTGNFWDRHFDCRITLDDTLPDLRPGMSARVVITTEVMRNVLWIPAQALFNKDGKNYVYVPSGTGFIPHDVTLVRSSESQAVVAGLPQDQTISLTNPEDQTKKGARHAGSASQAIRK